MTKITAGKLSRTELEQAKGPHCDCQRWLGRLIAHAEAVGEFAPDEPSPSEINDAIARAVTARFAGVGGRQWFNRRAREGETIIPYSDYNPYRNLGQALDAVFAFGAWASVCTDADGLQAEFDGAPSPTVAKHGSPHGLAPHEAAEWISRKLYDEIKRRPQ